MYANSRPVESNQHGHDPHLASLLQRYRQHPYLRPLADNNRRVFDTLNRVRDDMSAPVILDSGCGNGQSTLVLAQRHPQALVIGIDKSAQRLAPHGLKDNLARYDNAVLVRADVIDIWRLALAANWPIEKHCLFYPNPWPKWKHRVRRWYAHPVFPTLLALGGELELRTNWRLYRDEFSHALTSSQQAHSLTNPESGHEPISPFERKYRNSGHRLYQITAWLHPVG